MVLPFVKYDVSLHILDVNVITGVLDAEVCVRDAKHVGLCNTSLILGNPSSLVQGIEKATENLLDQYGPFEKSGHHLIKVGSAGSFSVGERLSDNDMDELVEYLNRVWRDG